MKHITTAVLALIAGLAAGIPMQLVVNQRASECLFETLDKDESATVSAFILSGPELKATLTFDGPIASVEDIHTAKELQAASDAYQPTQDENSVAYSNVLDFEHLRPEVEDDDDDDDDDDDVVDENEADGEQETDADRRRKQRDKQRQQFMAAKEKREKLRVLEQKKIREDGEPFVHTIVAPASGWYRVCMQASWYQIQVEFEVRKESELGLSESLHVNTYEERTLDEEDKLLDQDTADEEGIKDEDFQETRTLLKDLRKHLNQIQTLQQQERRRLTVHAETSSHSHSRMVLSSVLDTVLFMAVTSYQVYTIRKWFSGAPALG